MEAPVSPQVKVEPSDDGVGDTCGNSSRKGAGTQGSFHSMQEALRLKAPALKAVAPDSASNGDSDSDTDRNRPSGNDDLGCIEQRPTTVLREVKVEMDVAETLCPPLLDERRCRTPDSESSSDSSQPQDLSLPKATLPEVQQAPVTCITIKQEPDTSAYESQAESRKAETAAPKKFRIKLKLADIKTEPDCVSSVPKFLGATHRRSEPGVDGLQVRGENSQGSGGQAAPAGARERADTDEEDMESLPVYFPSHSRNGADPSERCQKPGSNFVLSVTSSVKFYQCGLCLEAFESPLLLKNHMTWHNACSSDKPLRCGACSKVFRYCSDLMQHTVVHTGERNHKCPECQATFTKASSLKEHSKTHTGERPFKCEQCAAEFKHSSHLKAHRRVHTGEKPYQCDICQAHFTSASYLKLHRRIHTGERRFKCDQCTAEFNQSLHLETHKRIHTGEKPFQCELCALTYRYKSSLKSHIYKAHCLVKPYKCETCPAAFNALEALRKHSKSHEATRKPFRCEECSAEFLSSAGLSQHKWTHTGEKPFKCGFCPAAFRDSTTLKRHKVIHVGQRPFKCDHCCASFKLMTHLSCHTKIHSEGHVSETGVSPI